MIDTAMSVGGRRRARRAAIAALVVAVAGGLLATVAGIADIDRFPDVAGIGLAVAMGGIGFGLVSWAKSLGLDEHVVEHRSRLALSESDQAAIRAVAGDSPEAFGRRSTIGVLLGASAVVLGFGLIGPIRSLGALSQGDRSRTRWRPGTRLSTPDGQVVRADVERFDQLITVFPADALAADDSQVVLIRVRPEQLTERTIAAGAIDGWVAYSKICTHAGCSVGLFGIDNRGPITVRELVCPCHQSVFDPLDAARPVGGPATRPLPQLPLGIDDEGNLIALADFDRPVGPLAWDEA